MPDGGTRRSLRSALLVVVLAAVALTWIATSLVSYVDARHELDELLDAHLAQTASLLLAQTSRDDDEIDIEHLPQLHRYERRVAFQLWDRGRVLRLHSANAPNTSPLSATLEGFSDSVVNGQHWRVFGGWDTRRGYLVQVGERRDVRDEIVANIAKNLLWPLAVALPALGLMIWLGIDRALQPLRGLNRQVEHRAPDNLAALDVEGVPAEVAPLVENLNRLFGRVHASIEHERRFTADAAHELRTPLAALRAQAQVAQRAADDDERARALDNVIAACDRAARLVEQLLTLARLEPDVLRTVNARCDLGEQARLAVAEIVPAAHARSIDIELEAEPAVNVRGDAHLLRVLLRNLLDNAVRYSPPHSLVRVRVSARDDLALLSVADEGSGVPSSELARLGQRFHRVLGSEAIGSGLGLSIVRRIAEVHGGTVSFAPTSTSGGLTATVQMPNETDSSVSAMV